jgi:hypothetical protein
VPTASTAAADVLKICQRLNPSIATSLSLNPP